MGKKVLVTGGAGFIGSYVVDELIKRNYEVTIYDNLENQVHPGGKKPDYLNRDARFIKGDVRDYDKFKKVILENEIIIHNAGAVGVAQSQYEIKKYVDVNIGGTSNLLDIVVNTKNKIEKIIVAASMSSYGEGKYYCNSCGDVRPKLRSEEQMKKGLWELYCPLCNQLVKPVQTDEHSVQNCNSIYAITKKVQEDMVLNIGRTYNIPSISLRYFNVYGPRQSLSNPYTGVAAIFLSRIKNNNRPVVYEDGLQTRDFVSVHDIVNANILAIEKSDVNYEAFNIGSGIPISIKDIAIKLAKLCQKDIEPEITNKFRKGDVRHCYADITKARNKLGFEPKISFEDGARELIEWSSCVKAEDKFNIALKQMEEKGLV